jgi:N-glycosylase/DNA lyase
MKTDVSRNKIIFDDVDALDIGLSLDCGQAFRWSQKADGAWHGVVSGRAADIIQQGNTISVIGDSDEGFWRRYLDLDRDYDTVCRKLKKDKWLNKAITEYGGIRILRQDTWEALCSFIISQNNNIPRIKGIIERLCVSFGDDLGNGDFSFPSANRLSECTVDDLAPLRAGFRAKYIIDAAQKVASGEVDLPSLSTEDMDYCRNELMKIKGVGAKVAECTLLYGCGRVEAFPVDVWVKRIMAELYPEGLPECTEGVEGIAQQFLFHWRRNTDM